MFDSLSRGPNGISSPYGTACISRYLNLDKMSNDFLQNLPQYGRNVFVINNVNIAKSMCPRERQPKIMKDTVPVANDNGFKNVIPGKE